MSPDSFKMGWPILRMFLIVPPALAEHFGAFALEPVTQAGKTTYLAHGKVDFFGDAAMARTGGAGGQNRA